MIVEFYINDVEIPISDDFNISLTFVNPLFSEKRINEAYSFNFNLPASPILNNILKNSKRVDAKERSFVLNAKIKVEGVLFVQGKIEITKSSNHFYSCIIYNDGKDLNKTAADKHISEYDYGSIEMWREDETLTAYEKASRWGDHVGQINDLAPDEGAYKFPMIKGYYDSPEMEEEKVKTEGLNYIFWKGGSVNMAFWDPYTPSSPGRGYVEGGAVRQSEFTADQLNWINTISPCLRIEHMLNTIISENNLVIEKNELEEIQEFKRLINFSCYVCDEKSLGIAPDSNIQGIINSYGRKYNLNDFTPDVEAWQIFKTLIELFSAVFLVKDDKTVDIFLSKNLLESEAVDLTEKTNPENIIQEGEGLKEISFYYDIDDESLKIINDELPGGWSNENIQKKMYQGIGPKLENGFSIKAIPLRTLLTRPRWYNNTFNFYSHWDEYTTKCSGFFDNAYLSFAFMKPREGYPNLINWLNDKDQLMLSSREFPESNDKPERFYLLLFHGRATSKQFFTDIDVNGNCSISTDPSQPLGIYLTCNLEKTDYYNISGFDSEHPNITVSDKTIYLNDRPNESKGTYINYHEPLAQFLTSTEEIQKTLYLRAHEINELAKFRKPKHRINSPEGGFEGIIKDFKVQLTKDSISPTSVTYLKKIYED